MTLHGIITLYAETVDDFGGFLQVNGYPAGPFLAWGITIFEIAGGITLALGYLRKFICAVFIIQLITGIILVHAKNGWFVVGYSSGGIEYSFLLLLCFFLVASAGKPAE